jgi:hypothetical protein
MKSEKQIKRRISQHMNKFEKRMLTTKNDLERVEVLNDMEELLEGELLKWHEILLKTEGKTEEERENYKKNCVDQIDKLESVVKTISLNRKELLPGAIEVARARKNSHEKIGNIKHVTDEI